MSQPQSVPVRFGSESAPSADASAEQRVGEVYRQVLKRSADATGLEHYVPLLESGATNVKTIVRDLLHSDEWKTKFVDGRSVGETVLALYDCALGRAPDVAAFQQLTSWEPRETWTPVIDGLLDAAEYDERFGPDVVPGGTVATQTAA